MTGTHPNILCYEHASETKGRSRSEGQHPSGRNNLRDAVMAMPGNDHRFMDEPKRDWPERTLRNPEGSPLLAASAAMRSVHDWCLFIVERLIGRWPQFLEWLDGQLSERYGVKWWEQFGWRDESDT